MSSTCEHVVQSAPISADCPSSRGVRSVYLIRRHRHCSSLPPIRPSCDGCSSRASWAGEEIGRISCESLGFGPARHIFFDSVSVVGLSRVLVIVSQRKKIFVARRDDLGIFESATKNVRCLKNPKKQKCQILLFRDEIRDRRVSFTINPQKD